MASEASEGDKVKAIELHREICGYVNVDGPYRAQVNLLARALSEARAGGRAAERAYIAQQIREHAADLVLFAGGNTRPLLVLEWMLRLPVSPEPERGGM